MDLTTKQIAEKTGISYSTVMVYLGGKDFTSIKRIRGLCIGVQPYHLDLLKQKYENRRRRRIPYVS